MNINGKIKHVAKSGKQFERNTKELLNKGI
ncbi:hypothetical protein BCD95_005177 [Clostridium beijerinckii]|uniref:Uncharacterized protein n=1 Tax=Clostridium beijerinckii TaxID=1520 RepID=A0AAE5LSM2_CLOBE|nr:hypothetical protein [Clostridium beijerinckii]OOM24363.1 hypothetical protein CLOBE_38600 [Clostridium beijerinckii]